MKYFIFIILIMLIGCGKQLKMDVISTSKNIDPKLQPYLDRFEIEAAAYGQKYDTSKLTMVVASGLSTTEEDVAGDCLMIDGHPEQGFRIRINSELINNPIYGIDNVEAVVFHELGHCLMNREHLNVTVRTTDDYNVYASLMNTSSGNDSNYINNRQAFIHELFTNEIDPDLYTLIPNRILPSQFPIEFYAQYGLH